MLISWLFVCHLDSITSLIALNSEISSGLGACILYALLKFGNSKRSVKLKKKYIVLLKSKIHFIAKIHTSGTVNL